MCAFMLFDYFLSTIILQLLCCLFEQITPSSDKEDFQNPFLIPLIYIHCHIILSLSLKGD